MYDVSVHGVDERMINVHSFLLLLRIIIISRGHSAREFASVGVCGEEAGDVFQSAKPAQAPAL